MARPTFSPREFQVHFSASQVSALRAKLEASLPLGDDYVWIAEGDDEWEKGPPLQWMNEMGKEWVDLLKEERWKEVEKTLNKFRHYKVLIDEGSTVEGVDEVDLHFVHAPSPEPGAIPLLLVHGWPGSFYEFFPVIDQLSNPRAYGSDAQAFHVVVPSLPSFIFSSAPRTRKGSSMPAMADKLNKLMLGLGYDRYAAQGGDWGSVAVRCLGSQHSDHCRAVHLNFCPAPPPPLLSTLIAMLPSFVTSSLSRLVLTAKEMQSLKLVPQGSERPAYYAIQADRPKAMAYGLMDSPIGLLAYVGETYYLQRFFPRVVRETSMSPEHALTQLTLYYLTRTVGTSFHPYANNPFFTKFLSDPAFRISVPTGMSVFPSELVIVPKAWVARTANLVWYKEAPEGGHFVATEVPQLYIDHVRDAFGAHGPLWAEERKRKTKRHREAKI